MRKRNFDEMISYFNRTVADMDINQKYKMTLLGIITAIGQEHEWTKPVLCKDCKHYEWDKLNDDYCCLKWGYNFPNEDDFCSKAERKDA